jgi:hypothetical protein
VITLALILLATPARLVSALNWALRNVPGEPPFTWNGGWCPRDMEEWFENRDASRRILVAALGDADINLLECPADAELAEESTQKVEAGK